MTPQRAASAAHASRAPAAGARRRPVQQRSQERYERLLDACAGLLDEAGPAGLTTKEVALRAEVPIGTLYQFFDGREGLLAALAARNLARFLDGLADRVAAAPGPIAVAAFTEHAVDEFVAMKRTVPGFGHLDFGLVDAVPAEVDDAHLLDAELDNNAAVAARLRAIGGELFAAPGYALALRVAMECADAVLKLAFRADPAGDPALVAECKRLLRSYLAAAPPAG
ncbi:MULTISPECIES: TetR family transcriptional regulator [Kitasatospora]|uniref:Putative TetR family transcriptional regulator n=1 Tax=Kitasatospora setae (strain ATCC 33774 / DSM 43861 / JCM 3304 / KCC A-0304 / NBRC 14216 / KM-6054) TaxID=452652 RepID=E4N629_KITSK|nr:MULTISPECIES: TetR family transcriptional regulator [Kitasatospora]BAJ26660.1 putative TetR family transcriptional regulator [Kitasatospora setae KM-6054]